MAKIYCKFVPWWVTYYLHDHITVVVRAITEKGMRMCWTNIPRVILHCSKSMKAEMYREITELRLKVSQLETEKDTLTQEHHETTIKLGEHEDMHESLTYELDFNTLPREMK